MLVVSSHDHDDWQRTAAQLLHNLETSHNRHVEVQENQIRLKLGDLPESLFTIFRLAHDRDLGESLQSFAQYAPGDGLIVDDQGLHHLTSHSCTITTISLA